MLQDGLQGAFRLERARNDHGPARQLHAGCEAQRSGVIERTDLYVGVCGGDAPQIDFLGPERLGLRLAEDPRVDAFGLSGGAGRVGHRPPEGPP